MPATETENGTVVDSVVDDGALGDPYCVVIPTSAATLAGFRAWSTSDAFPEHGKITFLEVAPATETVNEIAAASATDSGERSDL